MILLNEWKDIELLEELEEGCEETDIMELARKNIYGCRVDDFEALL